MIIYADPSLPPEIQLLLHAAKAKENAVLQQVVPAPVPLPVEPEYVFPPWPEGLPPPPPLPPLALPGKHYLSEFLASSF